jgi:hypothetical protein
VSGSCSIRRQLEPRYITCTEGAYQSAGGKEPRDNARDSKVKVLLVHVVYTSADCSSLVPGSVYNQKTVVLCFLQ